MHQYRCRVRLPNGTTTFVLVSASDYATAKQLAEAQYGKGNLLHHTRV